MARVDEATGRLYSAIPYKPLVKHFKTIMKHMNENTLTVSHRAPFMENNTKNDFVNPIYSIINAIDFQPGDKKGASAKAP